LNEQTIAKYIREQDKHDQIIDKISTKELESPFKGPAK
ncbi:MAG TPA: IS200/IS605 family transposase, partial [Desulfotomaculum sp.]|nr:IS200/IS605 family transposase [Desulfotomaculum sp.]